MEDIRIIFKTETICLFERINDGEWNGFYLYDKNESMNIGFKCKTEHDAIIEALEYYQEQLAKTRNEYQELKRKVDDFVGQIIGIYDEDDDDSLI